MTLHYRVSFSEAAAHLIDVSLTITDPAPAGQKLQLPNWIPGSYMIRDFSRNIVSLTATSAGREVSLEKLGKSSWQAEAGLAELIVEYKVYAWDLSVRAAHVDQTHAFFNGTSAFLSVDGQEQSTHNVVIERPVNDSASLFELSTTLKAVDVDAAGFGSYAAPDYDELIDHPVEIGTFKRLEFLACGVKHEVVLTGDCFFDEQRVIDDLTRICEYQINFFGAPAPVEHYVFMVMVVDAGYGGLEHRASTALMITRENLPIAGEEKISDKYLDFLGLCSHEYFHTWNVKRIKPAQFVPFDLTAESYTQLLWFFEGMTSYYDDLVLARTGLIDTETYLGVLSKTLTRVQRGQGRLSQTVTDSSFDAWNKFYKQDENAPNAIVSYYAKGALIALCLDALLRDKSNGDISLDTLMRVMWNRWLNTGAGLEEDEPQRLAAKLVDENLSDFFNQALFTTDELPIAQTLKKFGVSLDWCERLSSSDVGGVRKGSTKQAGAIEGAAEQLIKPWLGANVVDAAGGVRIIQIMKDGPASKAGLSAGDVIVAINDLSVSKADIDNHLTRYASLNTMPVHYFRLGRLRVVQLPVQPAPKDTAVLSVFDNDMVNSWLHDVRLADQDKVAATFSDNNS
ncbi:PDZ domain-containing protein [Granulosicoccus sp.]|nr:PDZ domain-containing protein [Granulosicoccus sp.]MDB4224067.1 PDZ domain-containing protein [Granulosicoccus sp.]